MKDKICSFLFAFIIVIFFSSFTTGENKGLDPVMKRELARLDELWNVLDQVAEKIWLGWTGYAEVPFLFDFENNVRMLVGHPNPPPEFELVGGVEVRGKKVHLDRRNEVPMELSWLTACGGGGPMRFGIYQGKPIQTVHMTLIRPYITTSKGDSESKDLSSASENMILLYVHELFHVFQRKFYIIPRHGDLHYNPDGNYAVYSEIEGEALQRAFLEKDDHIAKEYLKDLVAARKSKYRSMAQLEQTQEKKEEFREGTATYAEYVTLLEITRGYKPKITEKDDPYFYGFKNLDYYIERRLKDLEESKVNTFSQVKCYQYGCFQALLLNRFVEGWQKTIPEENHFLCDIIVNFLNMDEEEEKQVTKRLREKYNYDSLFAKHNPIIEARDNAFKEYYAQEGKVYVVNFKPIRELLIPEFLIPRPEPGSKTYRMGFCNVYPQGIKKIMKKDVLIEGKGKPMVTDQFYYLRYVDTQDQGFTINSIRQEGDIYYDAVVTTNGFTLRAPKIRVKERENRVKFIVLSKVKEK